MFAVATPQTISLPDSVSITFRLDPNDVSECFMDVVTEGGDIHTVKFNTRGYLITQVMHPAGGTGPTIQEWVAAGYSARAYPPTGYEARSTREEIEAAIAAQEPVHG
jgi:hypothetical protein